MSQTTFIPDVLPHKLIKISTAEYGRGVVDTHLSQLRLTWSEHDIAKIENQHKALCNAYHNESPLRHALDDYERNGDMSFETA